MSAKHLYLTLLIVGCGYRFSTGSHVLPDGSHALVIPMVDNRTTEPWAGAYLTDALRGQATQGGLAIVSGPDASRLSCRILAIDAIPRAVAMFGDRFRTREQEVRVRIEVRLTTGQDKPPLKFRLMESESYLSAPDLRGTEANRQLAIERVLRRLAHLVIERASRGF